MTRTAWNPGRSFQSCSWLSWCILGIWWINMMKKRTPVRTKLSFSSKAPLAFWNAHSHLRFESVNTQNKLLEQVFPDTWCSRAAALHALRHFRQQFLIRLLLQCASHLGFHLIAWQVWATFQTVKNLLGLFGRHRALQKTDLYYWLVARVKLSTVQQEDYPKFSVHHHAFLCKLPNLGVKWENLYENLPFHFASCTQPRSRLGRCDHQTPPTSHWIQRVWCFSDWPIRLTYSPDKYVCQIGWFIIYTIYIIIPFLVSSHAEEPPNADLPCAVHAGFSVGPWRWRWASNRSTNDGSHCGRRDVLRPHKSWTMTPPTILC